MAAFTGALEQAQDVENQIKIMFPDYELQWVNADVRRRRELLNISEATSGMGRTINFMTAGHCMLPTLKKGDNDHRSAIIFEDPRASLYNLTAVGGSAGLSGQQEQWLQSAFSKVVATEYMKFGRSCAHMFTTVMGNHPMNANVAQTATAQRLNSFFGTCDPNNDSYASADNESRSMVYNTKLPELLLSDDEVSPLINAELLGISGIPGIICIGANTCDIDPKTLLDILCFDHFIVEGIKFTTYSKVLEALYDDFNGVKSNCLNVLCSVITQPESLNSCKITDITRKKTRQQVELELLAIKKGQIKNDDMFDAVRSYVTYVTGEMSTFCKNLLSRCGEKRKSRDTQEGLPDIEASYIKRRNGNKGGTIKRKTIKRKTIKRKTIKRKTIKRKTRRRMS
jgi:hypothetical protein